MQISKNGINFIKVHEGCKLSAYKDGGGVWTIGYGHTGADVTKGLFITPERALELLAVDLAKFASGVSRLVRVPVNQNQFDALVSFAYNVGVSALENSTLLKMINNGNLIAASQQFKRWNKDNGIVVKGLTNRRAAEAKLFNTAA